MSNLTSLTSIELIRLIGNVIVEIDVLRSNFSREDNNRKKLDNFRDQLDTIQRKLARSVIDENTGEYKKLTEKLKKNNEELNQTINEVEKVAETLEKLVKFIGAVEEIAKLMP